MLENDSVRPFIWLYYVPLLTYGMFAVAWPKATSIIDPTLGEAGARLWVAACIAGTTTAMVGLGLRHGGTPAADMSTALLRQDWLGLWMQTGGHAAMFVVLLSFEVAALSSPYVWLVVFCVFAVSSYVIGCVLLTLQCARKLYRGWQLERR